MKALLLVLLCVVAVHADWPNPAAVDQRQLVATMSGRLAGLRRLSPQNDNLHAMAGELSGLVARGRRKLAPDQVQRLSGDYEEWQRRADRYLEGGTLFTRAVAYSAPGRVTAEQADRFNRPKLQRPQAGVERAMKTGFSHWEDGRPVFYDQSTARAPRQGLRPAEPRHVEARQRPARKSREVVSDVPAPRAAPRAAPRRAAEFSPFVPPAKATQVGWTSFWKDSPVGRLGDAAGRVTRDLGDQAGRFGRGLLDITKDIVKLPARAVKAFVQDIDGLIEGDRREDRRYATKTMALGLYKVALDMNALNAGPLRFGDISQKGGGHISGHASHHDGKNADVRLFDDPRLDTELIKSAVLHMPVKQFYLNQSRIGPLCSYMKAHDRPAYGQFCHYNGPGALLRRWGGHTEHVHIRLD